MGGPGAAAVDDDEEVEDILAIAGGDALQLTEGRGAEKVRTVELRCRIRLSVDRGGASNSDAKTAQVRLKGTRAGIAKGQRMLRALFAFREASAEERRRVCPWFAAGFCRHGAYCSPEGCPDGSHDGDRACKAQLEWSAQAPEAHTEAQPAGRPLLLALGCSGPEERIRCSYGPGEDEIIEIVALAVCPKSRREVGRFHRFVRPSAWGVDGNPEDEVEEEECGTAVEGDLAAVDAASAEPEEHATAEQPKKSLEDTPEYEDDDEEDEDDEEARALEAKLQEMAQAAGGDEVATMDVEEEQGIGEKMPEVEEPVPEPPPAAPPPAAVAPPNPAALAARLRQSYPVACFNKDSLAVPFAEVLADLLDWIPGLLSATLDDLRAEDLLIVAIRDQDPTLFYPRQCNLPVPGAIDPALQAFFFNRWACLRDVFRKACLLPVEADNGTLRAMQRHLSLPFTGEQESQGSQCMERTTGMAQIIQELLKQGWEPAPTASRSEVNGLAEFASQAPVGLTGGAAPGHALVPPLMIPPMLPPAVPVMRPPMVPVMRPPQVLRPPLPAKRSFQELSAPSPWVRRPPGQQAQLGACIGDRQRVVQPRLQQQEKLERPLPWVSSRAPRPQRPQRAQQPRPTQPVPMVGQLASDSANAAAQQHPAPAQVLAEEAALPKPTFPPWAPAAAPKSRVRPQAGAFPPKPPKPVDKAMEEELGAPLAWPGVMPKSVAARKNKSAAALAQ